MKRKIDKHGLSLNKVRQTLDFINRTREKYPEDACSLYYDISLRYVLPVTRNTPLSFVEDKGNVFLCSKCFKQNVELQEIYDLVAEHWHKVEEYKARIQKLKKSTLKRHTLLITEEEWNYLQEQLELFREGKA